MSTNRSTSLTRSPTRPVHFDYDIGWSERETDIKKLRSQIKIMARQLEEYDRIDRHNRAENFRLREQLDPVFDPELTIGEQIDKNALAEWKVIEWLERRGYTVSKDGEPVKRPRARRRVLIEDRSDRKR